MMLQIKRWLAPPVFPDDEPKTRRAILLNFALLTCMVLALCIIVGNLAGGKVPALVTGLDIGGVAVCLVLRRLANQGRVRLASGALLAVGLVGITMVVAILGTIRTPSTAVYMLLVVFAGLMFDLGGMIAMTVLCSLAIAGLIVAENTGLLPRPDYVVTISQWITYSVLFVWVGSLTLSSLQSTRRALARAEKEISERKQAEEALRASEGRLANIIETVPSGITFVDRSGQITFTNHAAEIILSLEKDAITARGYNDPGWKTTAVDGGVFPDEQQPFVRVMRTNKAVQGIEHAIEHPDGSRVILSINAAPMHDGHDNFIGMVAALTDITERKRAEDALRNRESMLQKIFDILPVGLWIADKDGQLLRGNPAGVKIWGAEPKVSPLEYGIFKGRRLPSGEEVASDDWALMHSIRDGVTIVDELLEIDAFDGKKKTILNYTAPVLDAQGDVQGAIVVNQDITERKRAEEALAQSAEQLRTLTIYWQNAIEAERTHIAREIHDEFGQSMTALKMDLTWLARCLPEGDEIIKRIEGMNTLVDDSITLMRRIATELRPNLLDDLGLNAALEWQGREFSRRNDIPCKLKLPEHDLGLDPVLRTSLYRIFQEALTNVSRHAQATRVDASLRLEDQTVILTIQDNGLGITESEIKSTHSIGLLGLHERAAQWGGEATIHGEAGKGTTVTVHIPLPVLPEKGGQP